MGWNTRVSNYVNLVCGVSFLLKNCQLILTLELTPRITRLKGPTRQCAVHFGFSDFTIRCARIWMIFRYCAPGFRC